jgi:hypothetical protein
MLAKALVAEMSELPRHVLSDVISRSYASVETWGVGAFRGAFRGYR